jgi:hypothetical protein
LRPVRFGVSQRHARRSSVTLCSGIRDKYRPLSRCVRDTLADTFRERARTWEQYAKV